MNELQPYVLLLEVTNSAVGFAIEFWLQSSLLIAGGLAIAVLLHKRGSAVQSAVYRTTLAAVLICPLVTCLLSLFGMTGWSIQFPSDWMYQAGEETSDRMVQVETEERLLPTITNETTPPAEASRTFDAYASAQVSDQTAWDEDGPASSSAASALAAPAAVPATETSARGTSVRTFQGSTVPPDSVPQQVSMFGLLAVGGCLCWLILAAGFLVRLAVAWRRLLQLRQAALAAEPPITTICNRIAAAVGVAPPEVLRSPFIPSPCLAGLRRPAVLLPDGELHLQLRDVLVHELAHLRRHDCHWQLLRRLALAVFYFQPLLWVLSRRLEASAEEVCDDYVVQFGGDRAQYAHRLVDIAELSSAPVAAAGVGVVSLRSMLAKRVRRIMDPSRSLSTRVGSLLLAAVIAGGLIGTTTVAFLGLGPQSSVAVAEPTVSTTNDADAAENKEPPADDQLATPRTYEGQVVDPSGEPVGGAKIHLIYFIPEPTGLLTPHWEPLAITDDEGHFHFSMEERDGNPSRADYWYSGSICAVADGYGFAWSTAALFEVGGTELQAMHDRLQNAPSEAREQAEQWLAQAGQPLRLVKDDVPIQGRILDINGQPVANAKLTLMAASTSYDESLDKWLAATQTERADFYSTRQATPKMMNGPQTRSLITPATTNAQGEFTLYGVGRERIVELRIEGSGIQTDQIFARTCDGEKIELLKEWRSPDLGTYIYHPATLTFVAGPTKPIVGVVRDRVTGEPLAGATIKSQKLHGNPISGWGQDYIRAVTDAEGRYQLEGLPIGSDNEIAALAADDQPYLAGRESANTAADGEQLEIDFELQRGVWVRGRVTDKATGEGLPGTVKYFVFPDNPHAGAPGGLDHVDLRDRYRTDYDGRFQIPVLPGRGIIAFSADNHENYPRGAGAEQIQGAEESGGHRMFRTEPHWCIPNNFHLLAEINPPEDREFIELALTLDAGNQVRGLVVDAAGRPVTQALYSGQLAEFATWRPVAADGSFTVTGYDPAHPRRLLFVSQDRNLAAQMILSGPAPDELVVQLQPAGSVKGRVVDESGAPLPEMYLVPWTPPVSNPFTWRHAGANESDPDPSPIALPPHPGNQKEHITDKEGRFEIKGFAAGVEYRLRAFDRAGITPARGRMPHLSAPLAKTIQVGPGEHLDLGDVSLADEADLIRRLQSQAAPPAGEADEKTEKPQEPTPSEQDQSMRRTQVKGQVTARHGDPAAQAHVAVVAMSRQTTRGGDLSSKGDILGEGTTDQNGQYELHLKGVSSNTHSYANLIVRKDGSAIAWHLLNLDASTVEQSFQLVEEEVVQGRLVDIEGQVADGVRLHIHAIMERSETPSEGVGYRGETLPAAWLPPVTTDDQGRFVIRGLPAGFGVWMEVEGDERFAPQDITLNTGMPEERGERDATYRSLVKNAEPGEQIVLPLAPAQLFEGTVTYEDTGEPAANARVHIWASQQQQGGSMISVAGVTDDKGRYRISAKPGVRFGAKAYPPAGTPYLARQTPFSKDIRWEAGERVKQIDLTLPRGVLVTGRVVEAGSGRPVDGAAIQYKPAAGNPNDSSDVLTGWQTIELSNEDGSFDITVLPGAGHLLAHAPDGSYVLQEIGSRELSQGKPGGMRTYAHAIEPIDAPADVDAMEVTLEFQRGGSATGRIMTEQGELVDEALVITRLKISPHSPSWRGHTTPTIGGHFELTGLKEGVEYPVYFLDAKRRLGATMMLEAGMDELAVVLQPCGSAKLRLIDSEGQAVADYDLTVHMVVTPGVHLLNARAMRAGQLAADSDFIENVDQTNYRPPVKSDAQGHLRLPALIPGATYRLVARGSNEQETVQELQVSAGQTVNLGDVVVERP